MKKISLLILALLLSDFIYSQNGNLIRNYSFELGQDGKTPGCWAYYSSPNSPPCRFNEDVLFWNIAKSNPNCGCGNSGSCPSPDWEDIYCTQDAAVYLSTNFPSSRFVRMADAVEPNKREGVRIGLIGDDGNTYTLKKNKTYILRIKLAMQKGDNLLRIHVAKYGEDWNKNGWGNVKQSDIGQIEMTLDKYHLNKFYSIQLELDAVDDDKDDVMGNIIFITERGEILIDDVELYERSCEQDLYIENTSYTFNKEAPFEAQSIIAGYEVANPPIGSGDVIVKNGADVTYKGVETVQLKPGFSVEHGGTFLAYIAPCGRTCPYFPVVDAGADANICNNNTYQLGMPYNNSFHYNWTSDPPSALAYLSSTSASNPVFTPPINGCGRAKYTLTVSCDNESKSDNVIINYNTTQSSASSINASITSNQNDCYLSLNIDVAECTEKVDIEVWNWSLTNKLHSYELKSGVDFTCCNFNWTMPDILTKCNNYKVIVSAKTICNPQISTINLDWIRNSVITIVDAPNVFTPNGDGIEDEFCFTVTGAETYEINIINPEVTSFLYSGSGIVCGSNICVWDGSSYEIGTFYYVATFDNDCQNEVSISGIVNVSGGNKNCVLLDSTASTSSNENLSETNSPSVIIHPNPANNVLYIDGLVYPVIASVIDLNGKQMLSTKLNDNQLDISNLGQGLYFIKLFTLEGNIVKKFVKQ
jgi:hypothetical protein